jgi:hypothetical protein
VKALENVRWVPRWVAHLGCVKGCLNYLGIEISEPWLYGGTGHAFVLNVHEALCPSGPTAWNSMKLFELGGNLGYRVEGVFASKDQGDFAAKQKQAYEHARQAIDQGHPCYGWELEIPEFYVVYGYDEVGYYFNGPGADDGEGPKPWQELGDTGIGMLEMYSVAPGEAADDATTVKQALTFALEIADSPEGIIFEHYTSGPAGYEIWIHALQEGKASDMGTRYNAGVWGECRRNAVGFLEEAKSRLPGRADAPFDDAISSYRIVADSLATVTDLYPWQWEASDEELLPVDETSSAAVAALQAARNAEVAGLEALERIAQALSERDPAATRGGSAI